MKIETKEKKMALGVSLGVVFGVMLHNLGLGLAIGIAFFGILSIMDKNKEEEK